MDRKWKPVPKFEGWYEVSNFGEVRSVNREVNYKTSGKSFRKGVILKPKIGKQGYKEVVLVINGKRHCYKVHKLVALAFLSNPLNLPCINHINEDKLDNRVCNLEWCSVQYNTLYSMPVTIIGQYDLSGNLIASFNHYTEAGNSVGGNKHGIFKCCNNKLKTYKGYVWKKIIEGH